jgi:hypothetical protein
VSEPKYPERPKFFAYRFCRLMAKTCLANEIGPDACWLLTVIAHTEDARGYRGAVTFYNEQLFPLVGAGSVDSLSRTRAKAISAGWLVYFPGGRKRPGKYWVNVPDQFADMDDSPSDERPEKYLRISAEESAEESETGGDCSAKMRSQPRGKCGANREESAEPSSLTLTLEESPSESGTADAAPASPGKSESDPAKTKTTKPKKARKPPGGPHHEAVRAFCDPWAAKYGAKYPFNGGKDASAIAWMLKQVGGDIEKLVGVVKRYLADGDRFFADDRHSLGKLRAQFPRWLVPGPAPSKQYQPPANAAVERAQRGDVAPPMPLTRLSSKHETTELTTA